MTANNALARYEIKVLSVLKDFADDNGICFLTRQTIADKCGMPGPTTVSQVTKSLVQKGLIEITKSKSTIEFGRTPNGYRVL